MLYHGRKVPESIFGLIDFNNNNAFCFELKSSLSNKGFIEQTRDYFNSKGDKDKEYFKCNEKIWDNAVEESGLKDNKAWRAESIKDYLNSFTVYHFHDTSSTSPMRGSCELNDNEYLKDNGFNLAAYLYRLEQTD